MEDTHVAQNVELTIDEAKSRLKALEILYDELDALVPIIQDVRTRQSPDLWTTIPEASQFAAHYRSALVTLEENLEQTRRRVDGLRRALAASVKDLEGVDADIQARLKALAERVTPAEHHPQVY